MIIHTIGLEGCGHHGLENVIVKILQKENNYVNKEILNNSILQKSRNCDNKLEFKQSIEKYLKNREALKQQVIQLMKKDNIDKIIPNIVSKEEAQNKIRAFLG